MAVLLREQLNKRLGRPEKLLQPKNQMGAAMQMLR